jgi:hypothetical protein
MTREAKIAIGFGLLLALLMAGFRCGFGAPWQ